MSKTGTSRQGIRRFLVSSITSSAIGLPITILLTPFVIHRVGVFTYGTYAVLGAWLAIGALLDFGLRAEMTRRIAEAHGRGDMAAINRIVREGASLLTCGAILIVGFGLALGHILVTFAFPDGGVQAVGQPYLLTLAVFGLLAFGFATDGFLIVLDGLQRSDVRQYAGVVSSLSGVGATLVLVTIHPGVWSLFGAGLLSSLLGSAVSFASVRRIAPFVRIRWSWPTKKVVSAYFGVSLLLVLTQVSDLVDFNIDRIYISRYVGTAAAGQYSLGTQLPLVFRSLSLVPLGFLIAATAELAVRKPALLERLYGAVSRLTYGIYAVGLAGLLCLAPAFYKVWLGPGFQEATTTARLLSVAMALNVLAAPWSLRAAGSAWYREIGIAAGCNLATNAVFSLVMTQQFGLQGALYGSIIGNACGFVALYVGLRRRERRRWLEHSARPAAVCLLGVVGGYLLARYVPLPGWWGLLALSAMIASAMCLGLVATRTIRPAEIADVLRRRRSDPVNLETLTAGVVQPELGGFAPAVVEVPGNASRPEEEPDE